MKAKHFFFALVAGVAVLASCKQEKPIFGISTKDNVRAVEFDSKGSVQTIQLETGLAWTVTRPTGANWVSVQPTEGTGSATITITTLPNPGKKKSTTLKFDTGIAGYVSVKVTQEGEVVSGDGLTYNTAWSPSEAKEWILANLPNETTGSSLVGSSPDKYWIRGYIHKINVYNDKVENFENSGEYGNATFYISDSMTETSNDVTCYQVYYLGNKKFVGPVSETNPDIKEGDEVVIYGPVANFNSKPNTLGKGAAFMYELNGVNRGGAVTEETDPTGDGTLENPYNAAGAIAYIKSAAYDPEKQVYVKGVISDDEIESQFNATYGTAIFSISEDGANYKTQFKCYAVYYLGNNPWIEGFSQVKHGDEVIVYGKVTLYAGTATYETAEKAAYIYSLNGKTTPEAAFFVPKTAYNVGAKATEAEIDVLGSVAWTATVAEAGAAIAEPEGGSGSGSGKVKVTFPANTSKEQGKTYTVTIATEDAEVTTAKSYTVVISQNPDVDGEEVIFSFNENTSTITTSQSAQSATANGVTISISRGAKNNNGEDIRVYKNETLTISTNAGTIVSIDLTAATKLADASEHLLNQFGAVEGFVLSDDNVTGAWTGSSNSVVFTASGAQVRLAQIRVVYLPQN